MSRVFFWQGLVESTQSINRPAQQVFEHLIEKKNYPIGMVEGWGDLQVELTTVYASKDPQSATDGILKKMPFPVTILGDVMNAKLWHWKVTKEEYCFGWKGRMGPSWLPLFTGEHMFEIKAVDDHQSCTIRHSEKFGGFLGYLFMTYLKFSSFKNHFSEFNKILKQRLE